jgi:hypothetical protein
LDKLMVRAGYTTDKLRLEAQFYLDDELTDPVSLSDVAIYDEAVDGTVITTLSPVRTDTGKYYVDFYPPNYPTVTAGNYYDQWEWVRADGYSAETARYGFLLVDPDEETEEESPIVEATFIDRPSWISKVGLELVEDVGNGMSLLLTHQGATPADPDNQIHYNIYYATKRLNVFSEGIKSMSTDTQVVFNLSPGNTYYFAVRATEFDPTNIDISSMDPIGTNMFSYPDEQLIENEIGESAVTINVPTTYGYPPGGYLLIGTDEIVRYFSKTF